MEISIPKIITKELAEETGWHIGDGSMNYYVNKDKIKGVYQLRGHKIDDISHYERRVKPLFKKIYRVNVSLRHMKSDGVFGFQLWSNRIVDFKNKKLNLPLGKKEEIKIPEIFLKDLELTKSVIRGIFDTDGCFYLEKKNNKLYPRVKISTTSINLSEQLLEKINNLNIRATKYTTKRKKFNWKPLQAIEIRGKEQVAMWFKIINPKNPKFVQKYQYFLDNS